MKLIIQPNRSTHLMSSITIEMVEDDFSPFVEKIAIEPLAINKEEEYVDIRIWHNKRKSKGTIKMPHLATVRFYLGKKKRKPKIIKKNFSNPIFSF